MERLFAPGCALVLYRPDLAAMLHARLQAETGPMALLPTCCRNAPAIAPGTQVVNVCPGCDRRFRERRDAVSTVSAWEVLAGSRSFPFPDYAGAEMAVHDACPTRTQDRVHEAVRTLLARMNIRVIEPRWTRRHAVCCGDSFFGLVPEERVKAQMIKRAVTMPRPDVVVYCVSCVKSMGIGGKKPRYLLDLVFGEETCAGIPGTAAWHAELDAFIGEH